jgi:PIN domain nuclease of toxin-antitoxin system
VSTPPLLDTHAWLWWLDGTGALRPTERRALDKLAEEEHYPFLCAISLWEMALLVELRRVELRQAFDTWIELAASPRTVTLLDISPAIAKQLLRFPSSFHRGPADRLIVATARALDLPVLTRDQGIQRSGLVHLWKP